MNGVQWGITSGSDSSTNDNGGLANQPQVNNSVVFRLGLTTTGSFDLSQDLSNITFLYATDLTNDACDNNSANNPCRVLGEPSTPPQVPLPATAWLFLSGLIPLAGFLRKRREVFAV